MATSKSQPTKVVTGKVRLSYVHLLEKFANSDDQDAKYSCVVMVPKSDKATMKKLRAAQQAALENGKTTKFKGRIPKDWHDTIKDGDDEDIVEKNPEYAGHWVFNTSAITKPGVVDRQLNEILDAEEIYSGMYARVSVNCFPYSNKGNNGVSFGLNHVQKVGDGEFLGGRSRAEDDFDELEDDELDDEGLI